jgi:hypothetical protein
MPKGAQSGPAYIKPCSLDMLPEPAYVPVLGMSADAFNNGVHGIASLPLSRPMPPPGLEPPTAAETILGMTGQQLKQAGMWVPPEPELLPQQARMRGNTWPLDATTMATLVAAQVSAAIPMSPEAAPWCWSGPLSRSQSGDGCDMMSAASMSGRRRRHDERRRRCQLQIATHLNDLEKEDPTCVIFVRQINKLGFNSPELLKEHYERYGPVAKVLVSNSHEKTSGAPFPTRLRPSGMGFVLMERPEDAAVALAVGEAHIVAGVQISARAFKPRAIDNADIDEAVDAKEASLDIAEVETTDDIADIEQASVASEQAETTASDASP